MTISSGRFASTLLICFGNLSLAATVITPDRSLGPLAITKRGNDYFIPATAGRQKGSNLFQSFSRFDLSSGDTADFTDGSPIAVKNVLVRITGSDPSTIDGTISCSIPNAAFYLIDPSGVVLGPDAKVSAKGSFLVTTANDVQLQHGGLFNGMVSTSDVLTTASPAAFGFLKATPARVTSSANRLAVQPGKTLSVVSGPIQVEGGNLVADSGQINLVAAGGLAMSESRAVLIVH